MTESKLKPGWTRVRFGDVVRQVKDTVDPESAGLERYIAGEHMDTDDLRIRRWGEVGDGYLGPAFHMRFKPGQVLYGSRRTYLRKVAVPDFEGICANTTFVLESKAPTVLLPDLLPFLMQTEAFNEYSVLNSKGSVNPYINFSDLAQYEFALPPLAEQRRMAGVLQANLRVVEDTRLAVDTAKVCLEAVREYLFAAERTRQVVLDKVLEAIEAGKSVVGINRPPNTREEYAVLKVSAVGVNGFIPEESKTLIRQQEFLSEYMVRTGDLLVTRANTPDLVGMTCYVEQDYPNLMLCDKTLRLVPKQGIAPRLLWEALWTRSIRQQIKSMATGTGAAMKNLSQVKFRRLKVQLPLDTSHTSSVLAQMSQAREAMVFVQKRLENTRSLYQAIINALFLRV